MKYSKEKKSAPCVDPVNTKLSMFLCFLSPVLYFLTACAIFYYIISFQILDSAKDCGSKDFILPYSVLRRLKGGGGCKQIRNRIMLLHGFLGEFS